MPRESASAYASSSLAETADYVLVPKTSAGRSTSLLKVVEMLSPRQMSAIARRAEPPAAPTAPGLERDAEWSAHLQAMRQARTGGISSEIGRLLLWMGLLVAVAAALLLIPMVLLRALS